jgi:hypothetical protein
MRLSRCLSNQFLQTLWVVSELVWCLFMWAQLMERFPAGGGPQGHCVPCRKFVLFIRLGHNTKLFFVSVFHVAFVVRYLWLTTQFFTSKKCSGNCALHHVQSTTYGLTMPLELAPFAWPPDDPSPAVRNICTDEVRCVSPRCRFGISNL